MEKQHSVEKQHGMEKKKHTPFWVTFAAGGIAGTIGAVITCPLEVVKTRLQSSHFHTNPIAMASVGPPGGLSVFWRPLVSGYAHVAGTVGVLRRVAVEEGAGALWSGVGATVVGVMPARAIYFSAYHRGKVWVGEACGWDGDDARVHLAAAAFAGLSVCTATNPIWLVKTRMQLQSSAKGHPLKYRNSVECVKTVFREEGLRGLYKGLAASYIGVAESTLQWVIYEKLKQRIDRRHAHLSPAPSANKYADYFFAAAGAKLFAAVIAYPHEVLRTRMRETDSHGRQKYASIRQTVRCIVKEEGVVAMYGGMTAHLLRVVPNSAIMFFCYEFLVHVLDS